ncbi:YSIRK-type signal peptide-containing protein [Staphylococcus sp. GDY8P45P]|uniref:YSIRK-targeted triacylglycerol lipase n=1 Tax=Staphylococcus sp. GDY8P45P TaxID=2804120 RepID=UPI001AEBFCF6|nr:YSIRK-type signal peptide-containing protein [Staphylococcus sp. GDY8P45P]
MEQKKNKYSIRKFTFGASSILIGSLLFIGVDSAQAAETEKQTSEMNYQDIGENVGETNSDNATGDSGVPVNKNDKQTSDNQSLHNDRFTTEAENENNEKLDVENNNNQTKNEGSEEVNPGYNEQDKTKDETSEEVDPEYNEQDKAKNETSEEVDPEYNEQDKTKDETSEEVDPEYNEQDKAKNETSKEVDPEYNEQDKAKNETSEEVDPEYNEQDKAKNETSKEVDPEYNEQDKAKNETSKEVDPEYNEQDKTKNETSKEVDPEYNEQDKAKNETSEEVDPEYNEQDKTKDETSKEVDPEYNEQDKAKEMKVNADSSQSEVQNDVEFGQLKNDDLVNEDRQSNQKNNDQDKSLALLKKNAVATTNNKVNQQNVEKTQTQPTKKAKQSQYKNQDPIILVHGFNGFTDDIKPSVLPHYWGGDKLNIQQDLEQKGYNAYEASIGALSSNHDRAVELYYYIKGGTVDYGAAHAEKYGHDRYGKTYEGVYKDWQPGQKVHLVGHSMGGQTIRQLEEYLRNGDPEEIEYQKQHGGDISPVFQGNNDNMISSITTLATPHNGTHAADQLGNETLIRQVAFDYAKLKGNKNSKVSFGLEQWGLKQKDDETYNQYVERLKDSKLWTTDDNGFYDLTRAGATELNKKTSLNPNIVYKTYTGESTRDGLFGRQKSDINMYLPMGITGNVIGKAPEKEWRVNDGLVSTISALHPFNQAYVAASNQVQKGVWQVTPIMHDWDHADFVGQDSNDTKRSQAELSRFYEGIASDLVRTESAEA